MPQNYVIWIDLYGFGFCSYLYGILRVEILFDHTEIANYTLYNYIPSYHRRFQS